MKFLTKNSFLDSALNKTLTSIADGDAENRGVALGKEAGLAIINDRLNDGSAHDPMGQVAPSDVAGALPDCTSLQYCFCS
ncbi:MAG: hypothetical protein HC905_14210 [Bacteroidales bacterium]|nr:hypothetical protein [Bacteroidales bacterium]